METCKAHCLIFPYPLQGHINPMLHFSMRLQYQGIKITLVTTKFLLKTLEKAPGSISMETISDGYDEGGSRAAGSAEIYLDTFQRVGSETLSDLLSKLQKDGSSVDCIIYDALLPWASNVTKRFGILGGAFFTQSCAVNNIYYHVYKGLLKLPLTENGVRLPGLPLLATSDLPSFLSDYGSYPAILRMAVNQFLNIGLADWLLFNTFNELEIEVIDWMSQNLPVTRTIGPPVPLMYLDRRLQDDKEYGLNMFQPMTDACMDWLNERSEESVVYVSFGSLAESKAEQMEEMAWGLRNIKKPFMWVVRKSEENKLPKGFLEETKEKGLVVSWCPQLQVLAHKSIGCFVTHCGWNSTLEALSLGVPMVAIPQWADQSTNAKFVMDCWKTGIKAESDDNSTGIVKRHIIEECIRQVMEGEEGKELRTNGRNWQK